MSLASSCQRKQTYTSEQLGLTISYPADWIFLEESEQAIMLRARGDAAVTITIFENQLTNTDLTVFMTEQLDSLVEDFDPNMPIEYGEISERKHERYSVVTGYVSGYSKIKVSPIDPIFRAYTAAIQSKNRIVFVIAVDAGHESPVNAIDEIIKGMEFR